MTGQAPGPLTTFDLSALADALASRLPAAGRLTERLTACDGVTLLLLGLDAGAALKEHAANGVLTLQVLRGTLLFSVGDEVRMLAAGQAVVVPAGVRHAVEAGERAVALLVIAETSHG